MPTAAYRPVASVPMLPESPRAHPSHDPDSSPDRRLRRRIEYVRLSVTYPATSFMPTIACRIGWQFVPLAGPPDVRRMEQP